MNIKAWLTKANQEHNNDDKAEDDRQSDVFELEFATVFGDGVINLEESEGEDSEDEGELRDAEPGRADGIDNQPGMGKPRDFSEEKPAGHSHEGVILFGALDENVVGSGKANHKFGEDERPRIANGSKNAGSGGPEQDGDKGLNDGEGWRRAGLNDYKPDSINGHEDKMNRQESTGVTGEKGE